MATSDCTFLLLLCGLAAVHAADGLTPSNDLGQPFTYPQAAKSYIDVPYLPPERDTVSWTDQGLAHRARMNVHVPQGAGPFPALIMIHGGGWMIGSKDPGPMLHDRRDPKRQTVAVGLERGYVMISCNYILGEGIHPQVQRDTREMIRHLRAHSELYRIDPHRIGAFGSSAGGWLISSTCFTTAADYLGEGQRTLTVGETQGRRQAAQVIPVCLDEVEPAHPGISARLGAIAFDFFLLGDRYGADDPSVCTFMGIGAQQAEFLARAPADLPPGLIETVILGGKFRGQAKVHGPDFEELVADRDGKDKVTVHDRVFQFFDARLRGPEARTPAAELRPNRRIFTGSIEASFAPAGPATVVHYTTDGSTPTRESRRFTEPFTVGATTTLRWLAITEDMQPSGVCTAVLEQGTPPPEITGPASIPSGRVGAPLSVTFIALDAGLWDIAVQSRGLSKEDQKDPAKKAAFAASGGASTIGLRFDRKTATLAGTPTKHGTWVVQVRAARDTASFGSQRTYMLTVLP